MPQTHHDISTENLSIPGLFQQRVLLSPDSEAYRSFDRDQNQWVGLSWQEVEQRVARFRKSLLKEGLEKGERIAIMLPNCLDWTCFDLAGQSLGLIIVPLFANDRPDNVSYILEATATRVFFCQNFEFYQQLMETEESLEQLQKVVFLADEATTDQRTESLASWLEDEGGPAPQSLPDPDELATIVYTSGTTGRPKGVMLSHRNIMENAAGGLSCISVSPDDLFLSFLPLSHMLERTAGYYLPMIAGATVAYARSIQELSEDLTTVKPTVLVAVPRIFERLHAKIQIGVSKASAVKQLLFKTASRIGWQHYLCHQGRRKWNPTLLLHPLLDKLVGTKVREKLGGRLGIVISGGAALSYDVAKTLIGLGLPIYQGYGLTESSPVISVNRVDDNRPDSVGEPLPGIKVKFSELGELLVHGSCVMMGYWQNEEATREVIDEQGWLHTGDVAERDGAHLKITGRLKEILVLSNSEKVSPTDLETAIASDPLFEQSMVVGEGRPYLTLLAVLNPELYQQLAAELQITADDESLHNDVVRSEIMRRVEKSLKNFPGYAWVRNVSLTLKPWTIEQGYLTPTMKLKRKNIITNMQDEIERMYQT